MGWHKLSLSVKLFANLSIRVSIPFFAGLFSFGAQASDVATAVGTAAPVSSVYVQQVSAYIPNGKDEGKPCPGDYNANDPVQIMQHNLEGCAPFYESSLGLYSQWGIGAGSAGEQQCPHTTADQAASCFNQWYLSGDPKTNKNLCVWNDMKQMGSQAEDADAMFAWSQLVLFRPGWATDYAKAWQSAHPDICSSKDCSNSKDNCFNNKDFVQFFLAEELKDMQRLPAGWAANASGWKQRVVEACNGGVSHVGKSDTVTDPVFCSVDTKGSMLALKDYDNPSIEHEVSGYSQPVDNLGTGSGISGGSYIYSHPMGYSAPNNSASAGGGSDMLLTLGAAVGIPIATGIAQMSMTNNSYSNAIAATPSPLASVPLTFVQPTQAMAPGAPLTLTSATTGATKSAATVPSHMIRQPSAAGGTPAVKANSTIISNATGSAANGKK